MTVYKMLDISSKHVSKEWLDNYNENGRYYFGRTNYGCIIWAPIWLPEVWLPEENNDPEWEMLLPIFKLAEENGCEYISIDADGRIYDKLPQYEWE